MQRRILITKCVNSEGNEVYYYGNVNVKKLMRDNVKIVRQYYELWVMDEETFIKNGKFIREVD